MERVIHCESESFVVKGHIAGDLAIVWMCLTVGSRVRGSTIAMFIWGVIAIIGVVVVYRCLRAGQNEMAYIAALFAANDGASVP